jgi:hypothetical protein
MQIQPVVIQPYDSEDSRDLHMGQVASLALECLRRAWGDRPRNPLDVSGDLYSRAPAHERLFMAKFASYANADEIHAALREWANQINESGVLRMRRLPKPKAIDSLSIETGDDLALRVCVIWEPVVSQMVTYVHCAISV